MDEFTRRFLIVVDDLVAQKREKSARKLSEKIGIHPSQISEARNGKRAIPIKYADDLQSIYGVNPEYLISGLGERYLSKDNVNALSKSNTKDIGEIQYPLEEDGASPFVDLGDGQYLMIIPLVTEYAYAGYLSGYSDPEYLEELPKHCITVKKHYRGLYRAFEILGDSMTDGTDESIRDGSIVTGRFLSNHHWRSKLNYNRYRFWVIVHKTEGILTKEIINHDVNTGMITLRSLNPDKESYPDFDLHLDDIKELYNILHVGRNV